MLRQTQRNTIQEVGVIYPLVLAWHIDDIVLDPALSCKLVCVPVTIVVSMFCECATEKKIFEERNYMVLSLVSA